MAAANRMYLSVLDTSGFPTTNATISVTFGRQHAPVPLFVRGLLLPFPEDDDTLPSLMLNVMVAGVNYQRLMNVEILLRRGNEFNEWINIHTTDVALARHTTLPYDDRKPRIRLCLQFASPAMPIPVPPARHNPLADSGAERLQKLRESLVQVERAYGEGPPDVKSPRVPYIERGSEEHKKIVEERKAIRRKVAALKEELHNQKTAVEEAERERETRQREYERESAANDAAQSNLRSWKEYLQRPDKQRDSGRWVKAEVPAGDRSMDDSLASIAKDIRVEDMKSRVQAFFQRRVDRKQRLEAARSEVNRLRGESARLETATRNMLTARPDLLNSPEDIARQKERLEKLKKLGEDIAREYEHLRDIRANVDREYDGKLADSGAKKEALQHELNALEREAESVQKELQDDVNTLVSLESSARLRREELDTYMDRRKHVDAQIAKRKEELSAVMKDLDQSVSYQQSMQQQLTKIEEERQSLSSEIQSLQGRLADNDKRRKEMEEMVRNKAEAVRRAEEALTKQRRQIEKYEKEVRSMREQRDAARRDLDQSRKRLQARTADIEALRQQNQAAVVQVEDLNTEILSVEDKMREKEQEIERLKRQIDEGEQQRVTTVGALSTRRRELEMSLDMSRREVQSRDRDLEDLKRQLQNAEGEQQSLRGKLKSLETERDAAEELKASLGQKLKARISRRNELETSKKSLEQALEKERQALANRSPSQSYKDLVSTLHQKEIHMTKRKRDKWALDDELSRTQRVAAEKEAEHRKIQASIQQAQRNLEEKQRLLQAQHASLEKDMEELKQRQQRLENEQSDERQLQSTLETEVGSTESAIKKVNEERQAIEAAIEDKRRQIEMIECDIRNDMAAEFVRNTRSRIDEAISKRDQVREETKSIEEAVSAVEKVVALSASSKTLRSTLEIMEDQMWTDVKRRKAELEKIKQTAQSRQQMQHPEITPFELLKADFTYLFETVARLKAEHKLPSTVGSSGIGEDDMGAYWRQVGQEMATMGKAATDKRKAVQDKYEDKLKKLQIKVEDLQEKQDILIQAQEYNSRFLEKQELKLEKNITSLPSYVPFGTGRHGLKYVPQLGHFVQEFQERRYAIAPLQRRGKALIVGCSYNKSRGFLRGTSHDVQNWKSYLVFTVGWRLEDITLLMEGDGDESRQPTRHNIMHELERMRNEVRPGENLAVIFAGHGSLLPVGKNKERQGVFCPSDFDEEVRQHRSAVLRSEEPRRATPASKKTIDVPAGVGFRVITHADLMQWLYGVDPSCTVSMVFDCGPCPFSNTSGAISRHTQHYSDENALTYHLAALPALDESREKPVTYSHTKRNLFLSRKLDLVQLPISSSCGNHKLCMDDRGNVTGELPRCGLQVIFNNNPLGENCEMTIEHVTQGATSWSLMKSFQTLAKDVDDRDRNIRSALLGCHMFAGVHLGLEGKSYSPDPAILIVHVKRSQLLFGEE
ncbi:unnamed protein product [Vitrella brassicaformis CCMP3155]|uniref:Uncharacterized protein n=3 Tax=Vitrella brassicaformis TaxID=1169539 RepID=A0A0G4H315_VITBC|nr:unnamed protein product [Vitrella brassicaformis CCMP3155]|eukprot:CEM37825.1 unnamed protein product [Vitrella brassicaformis CCMP3155]